jgi:hypothetical protein
MRNPELIHTKKGLKLEFTHIMWIGVDKQKGLWGDGLLKLRNRP